MLICDQGILARATPLTSAGSEDGARAPTTSCITETSKRSISICNKDKALQQENKSANKWLSVAPLSRLVQAAGQQCLEQMTSQTIIACPPTGAIGANRHRYRERKPVAPISQQPVRELGELARGGEGEGGKEEEEEGEGEEEAKSRMASPKIWLPISGPSEQQLQAPATTRRDDDDDYYDCDNHHQIDNFNSHNKNHRRPLRRKLDKGLNFNSEFNSSSMNPVQCDCRRRVSKEEECELDQLSDNYKVCPQEEKVIAANLLAAQSDNCSGSHLGSLSIIVSSSMSDAATRNQEDAEVGSGERRPKGEQKEFNKCLHRHKQVKLEQDKMKRSQLERQESVTRRNSLREQRKIQQTEVKKSSPSSKTRKTSTSLGQFTSKDYNCCRQAQEQFEQKISPGSNFSGKNQMILIRLAAFAFIYTLITSSSIIGPTSATNYWPLTHQVSSSQQKQQQQQQVSLQSSSAAKKGQLLIGQHYSNFSSIIPYSIVQDSDYNPVQEDEVIQEIEQQQQQQQSQDGAQEGSIKAVIGSEIDNEQSEGGQGVIMGAISQLDRVKSISRALLDSNRLILPHMQQIKSRFNQGCVGGTKCQFFAVCWMSGGSLGASCGLLMTCCVTPSRQEIQPGFYGPVVNDPYCGRSTSKINRIVGGTDASFGQFPWQAFVQVGGSRCGGALISSRHVVTAGHCVARSQHSPSSIKVTLGDYILNSDIESIPHEVFSVVEVLLHPNFRFTPQADRYDVAVLELDRTASYKDNIKPICLPQKDAAFVGRVAYVAGWGALQAGSKLRPKVLQHVAVPVIENHVCEGWHRRKGIDIRIYDEMMCAGYEIGQRDACQGDSGGPLMLNQFGVWYLVGIVSAGYSCAKQYQPGIYHRVSSSSDWISSNIYQQRGSK